MEAIFVRTLQSIKTQIDPNNAQSREHTQWCMEMALEPSRAHEIIVSVMLGHEMPTAFKP
jgi:hypothetical protein